MKIPPTFLQKVDSYIQAHLSEEDLNLKLCGALHLSPHQVYRKIKKQTGQPPTNYIRQKRLERAFHWIQNTDFPLSQIAYEVGFNHPAYFTRSFVEQYGFPPSDLRRLKMQE